MDSPAVVFVDPCSSSC